MIMNFVIISILVMLSCRPHRFVIRHSLSCIMRTHLFAFHRCYVILCYLCYLGCINCVALGDAQMMQSDGCCGCNDTITKEVELSTEQLAWIEGQKHQPDESTLSIEQKVVSACMKLDEYTVFGIIRCKSSVAKCEGAQEALENIQQQFSMKKGEVVTKENIDICAKDCGCE